jgi:large subunit ribosomal protein L18
MIKKYQSAKKRRTIAVRSKLRAKSSLPRLSIFRSLKFLTAQIIDDQKGITLAHAKGKNPAEVGAEIAKKAHSAKVKAVVVDRGSYRYHGRIQKLVDVARGAGLTI